MLSSSLNRPLLASNNESFLKVSATETEVSPESLFWHAVDYCVKRQCGTGNWFHCRTKLSPTRCTVRRYSYVEPADSNVMPPKWSWPSMKTREELVKGGAAIRTIRESLRLSMRYVEKVTQRIARDKQH